KRISVLGERRDGTEQRPGHITEGLEQGPGRDHDGKLADSGAPKLSLARAARAHRLKHGLATEHVKSEPRTEVWRYRTSDGHVRIGRHPAVLLEKQGNPAKRSDARGVN